MNNKGRIIKECTKGNMVRKVYNVDVEPEKLISDVNGSLLITGRQADHKSLLEKVISEYMSRDDMPTVMFSSHPEHLKWLEMKQDERIKVYAPSNSCYCPLYGMTTQQVLDLIEFAGEAWGYKSNMEWILRYGKALLDMIAFRCPISLKSIKETLENNDRDIVNTAKKMNASQESIDIILKNQKEGLMFREIFGSLEAVFENVCGEKKDERHNLMTDLPEKKSWIAFYQISSHQKIMDAYLKEELYMVLKKVPKIRVILDEVIFAGETDALLTYLFQKKSQGMVELVVISKNARKMLPGARLEFANICLFQHDNPEISEYLSKKLFGTYLYHYPVHDGMQVFARRIKNDKWHMAVEERLRVRSEDLCETSETGETDEKIAVRIRNQKFIYMITLEKFLK